MIQKGESVALSADNRSAQAERILEQRSLARCAENITDPRLRAEVERLADGRTTPQEFMAFVDHTPQAWRGLDRSVNAYVNLTDDQRASLLDQYDQQLAAVQAELDHPTPRPDAAQVSATIEEDDTWEGQQSWLE